MGLYVKSTNVCGPMTNLHNADEFGFTTWSPSCIDKKGKLPLRVDPSLDLTVHCKVICIFYCGLLLNYFVYFWNYKLWSLHTHTHTHFFSFTTWHTQSWSVLLSNNQENISGDDWKAIYCSEKSPPVSDVRLFHDLFFYHFQRAVWRRKIIIHHIHSCLKYIDVTWV